MSIITQTKTKLVVVYGFWVMTTVATAAACIKNDAEHDISTWYDKSHEYLSQKFCEPAVWFDNFFSNERSDEERAGSFIRWRNEFSFIKDDGFTARSRISAKLSLPGATRRLHLLLMREDEDETMSTLTDSPPLNQPVDTKSPLNTQRNQIQLGLRYDFAEERFSRFSISGGIHGGTPLEPFVKGRYRYTQPLTDEVLARFIATVYWKNLEGFGETTRVDLEQQLSDTNLLRWSNSATFSEISYGFELGSELSLLHQISERSAISVGMGVLGYTQPATFSGITVNSRYRHNFFRDWLFYEIEPAVNWLENEQGKRDIVPAITLRLEVQFERY